MVNSAFYDCFAVFDPSPLSVCISCSFFMSTSINQSKQFYTRKRDPVADEAAQGCLKTVLLYQQPDSAVDVTPLKNYYTVSRLKWRQNSNLFMCANTQINRNTFYYAKSIYANVIKWFSQRSRVVTSTVVVIVVDRVVGVELNEKRT